ncbi:MAG: hypothetical protein ACRCWH_09330, partial [Aeromonas veronii]
MRFAWHSHGINQSVELRSGSAALLGIADEVGKEGLLSNAAVQFPSGWGSGGLRSSSAGIT